MRFLDIIARIFAQNLTKSQAKSHLVFADVVDIQAIKQKWNPYQFPNLPGTENPSGHRHSNSRGKTINNPMTKLTKNKSECSERSYYLSTLTRKLNEMLQKKKVILSKNPRGTITATPEGKNN